MKLEQDAGTRICRLGVGHGLTTGYVAERYDIGRRRVQHLAKEYRDTEEVPRRQTPGRTPFAEYPYPVSPDVDAFEHGTVTEQTKTQPSDADLAPIPETVPSRPIRRIVQAIYWPAYLMTPFVFQCAWRLAKIPLYSRTPRHAIAIFGGTVWLTALTGWERFVLSLRRSWIITPGTHL